MTKNADQDTEMIIGMVCALNNLLVPLPLGNPTQVVLGKLGKHLPRNRLPRKPLPRKPLPRKPLPRKHLPHVDGTPGTRTNTLPRKHLPRNLPQWIYKEPPKYEQNSGSAG